jgi:DNA-directed RNA polymerase specialized sigma24 family protein
MSDHRAVEPRSMTLQALEHAIEEAFPVLYQRLHSRFRDPQLADEVSRDCLSQAFELWRDDPTFFLSHDLTAWSSVRANWRAIDRLRVRSRRARLPDENPYEDDRPVATASGRFDPHADRVAGDRLLTWEALNRLDEIDRLVLIGHYYDGRSDQDLGTELFGETGSLTARGLRVWRIRQRAQARLRDLLLAGGVEPADYAGQAV